MGVIMRRAAARHTALAMASAEPDPAVAIPGGGVLRAIISTRRSNTLAHLPALVMECAPAAGVSVMAGSAELIARS
jgi:hypothetical protein